MARAKRLRKKAMTASTSELPALAATSAGCEKVWTGALARLRVYDQPGSTGKKVLVYTAPGRNKDYVGYSDDSNLVRALFLARDNGNKVTGYTNSGCRIEWLDY